jgi:hypothetical protein
MGGELLETLPPGNTDMLLKLSSLVPDDPTVDATSEQVSHTATVHVAVDAPVAECSEGRDLWGRRRTSWSA